MTAPKEHQKGVARSNINGHTERAFKPSDLSAYTFKQRLTIRAASIVFYFIIKIVGLTVRFKVEGLEHLEEVERAGHIPVYVLWHNRTFLGSYWLRKRGIVVLTSKSFDGEYIARFIQRFGFGAVRGSSTRGGIGAIVEMVKLMRRGHPTAITPDGPRGPRYVTKMGPVLLAKKTGHPMLPMTITPESFWKARSWDSYKIPKPFTRALVRMGAPIFVPATADTETLEAKREELQRALEEVNTPYAEND